jgi:hypothetical protein
MQLAKPMGNLFDISEAHLNTAPCNRCNMSWYRDLSIYFHGLRSAPAVFEALTRSAGFM